MTVYGGIETGGSKWECAVGTGPDDVGAADSIPTTLPPETIARAVAFFERAGPVDAIGIGSFGPIDRRPGSPTWGYVTTTPKPGWSHTDVAGEIGRRMGVPVAFDTDVNAAALAEGRWGAARGLHTFCYITVGTGIGGGAVVNGSLVHGLVHPEFGHLRIPHDLDRDPFPGTCPFHGDCWEGLAAAGAIARRWGRPRASAVDDEDAWKLEADYLALGVVAVMSVLSPQRVILGGGVMRRDGLHALVRQRVLTLMDGYLDAGIRDGIDGYILPPGLGTRAGVLGALVLAEQAAATPPGRRSRT